MPRYIRATVLFIVASLIAYVAATLAGWAGMLTYMAFDGAPLRAVDLDLLGFQLLISAWLLPAIGGYQVLRQALPAYKQARTILYLCLGLPMACLMGWYAMRQGEGTDMARFMLFVYCCSMMAAYVALLYVNRPRRMAVESLPTE